MEKCSDKRNGESLTQSRARYNAFKALASPAYICMTSPDPILSAFKLSNEFDEFKKIEKEFAVSILQYIRIIDSQYRRIKHQVQRPIFYKEFNGNYQKKI